VRQNGLLAIYTAVSRVFDGDDSADLSKTMAALDSRLKMAERCAQIFERYRVSERRPVSEPRKELRFCAPHKNTMTYRAADLNSS
jgi:hypothetical protein